MATKAPKAPRTAVKLDAPQIGETAGAVWHALSDQGPMTVAKLVKIVGQPRDSLMLALGWLAREDKLLIEGGGRTWTVSLRPE
ncbi:MAG: winged helix-turn-helix domain-containing protein [Thermoguttaceae bacterium]